MLVLKRYIKSFCILVNSAEVCFRHTDCQNGGQCRFSLQFIQGYCECPSPYTGFKCENIGDYDIKYTKNLINDSHKCQ